MSINSVSISGNITRDPELKVTQGGSPILSIGVAVNDRRRNAQTGEWEDVPNFVDCVMFGNRAQAVARLLAKGMKVAILGKLRQSRWQDSQTGQNRSKIEVIVDEVELMPRGGQQQVQQPPQAYQQAAPLPYQQPQYQTAPQQPPQAYQQPQQPDPVIAQLAAEQQAATYDQDIPF